MVISDKIRSFRTNDRLINWCSKKKIKLKYMNINFERPCLISFNNTTLLNMCCIHLVDLQLNHGEGKRGKTSRRKIIRELGQRCTRLKNLHMTLCDIYDSEIARVM